MYSSTISLNSSKYFQDSLDYYNEEQRGMYWFSDNKQGLNRGQAFFKHRIKGSPQKKKTAKFMTTC